MRGTNCIVLRHEAPYIPRENPSLGELHPRHARERRPAQQEDPARTPRPGGRKFRPPSRPLESTDRRRSPQGPRLTAARRLGPKAPNHAPRILLQEQTTARSIPPAPPSRPTCVVSSLLLRVKYSAVVREKCAVRCAPLCVCKLAVHLREACSCAVSGRWVLEGRMTDLPRNVAGVGGVAGPGGMSSTAGVGEEKRRQRRGGLPPSD